MGETIMCYKKCALLLLHNFDCFLVIVTINIICLASGIDHCVIYVLSSVYISNSISINV